MPWQLSREKVASGVSAAVNRRALVTGAASGIGEAVVRRLLLERVDVIAVDRDESGLGPLEQEGARPLVADLSRPEDRARVVDAADGADYLVNAAGIIRLVPIFETTVDDWRDIFTVNAEAVFFLCQEIGPRLAPERRDRQPLLHFGEGVRHHRGGGVRGLEGGGHLDHPLLRLCARLETGQGQRRLPRHHRYPDAGTGARRRRADPRHHLRQTWRRAG